MSTSGPSPPRIAPDLWGQQLDAQERMEESWHDIQGYLREVFSWAGVDGLEAEELSVIPGLDEIFALTDIKCYAEDGEWDVVVVDCAPDGRDHPVPVAARHPRPLHGAALFP